jgi:hypothetical protein
MQVSSLKDFLLIYLHTFTNKKHFNNHLYSYFFFFLIYVGCPGQLTRTTTIPHGPLDILQAQEQVRHCGGDRRAHRGSNPGRGRNKSHGWPQQLDPQVHLCSYFWMWVSLCKLMLPWIWHLYVQLDFLRIFSYFYRAWNFLHDRFCFFVNFR